MQLREDKGALWENFCLNERQKEQQRTRKYVKQFYWRNRSKQEIDLIEESDGGIRAFEFKYTSAKQVNIPKTFSELYPGTGIDVINRGNFVSHMSAE